MKRLTKDERLGAISLAVIALLLCGASILFKRHSGSNTESLKGVESVILASDSLKENKTDTTVYKDHSRHRSSARRKTDSIPKSEGQGKGVKSRKKRTKEKKQKAKEATRDILSEPIPQ